MVFTIKTNGKFNGIKINKQRDGDISSVEIDFAPPDLWSDFEFWLDDGEKLLDYAKMNISKRNKMQFTK
jgi:hypothetical protein